MSHPFYSDSMIKTMCDSVKGKTIEKMEFVEDPEGVIKSYWVMKFPDGFEMCFRFMTELIREAKSLDSKPKEKNDG